MRKPKITIEDLIRWEGREPGGVEPKLFVSEVMFPPNRRWFSLVELSLDSGLSEEASRTLREALESPCPLLMDESWK